MKLSEEKMRLDSMAITLETLKKKISETSGYLQALKNEQIPNIGSTKDLLVRSKKAQADLGQLELAYNLSLQEFNYQQSRFIYTVISVVKPPKQYRSSAQVKFNRYSSLIHVYFGFNSKNLKGNNLGHYILDVCSWRLFRHEINWPLDKDGNPLGICLIFLDQGDVENFPSDYFEEERAVEDAYMACGQDDNFDEDEDD